MLGGVLESKRPCHSTLLLDGNKGGGSSSLKGSITLLLLKKGLRDAIVRETR